MVMIMQFETWQSILMAAGIGAGGILAGLMLERLTRAAHRLVNKYLKL
jgi:hypothetical protein